MRTYYEFYTANAPRQETDQYFEDRETEVRYDGFIQNSIEYLEQNQLKNVALWKRFVNQFRENTDIDYGWRGEYWGKMMRGACFVYSCTCDAELYKILADTIEDMLSVQEESGRISSYRIEQEFEAWDLWCRKYVLLGMQYFLEICQEKELYQKVVDSLCEQMDDIISKIGRTEDGKRMITSATRNWRGLNSSSLLEPTVRLYSITKKEKYLAFAGYIVECGGTDVANIFDLAYEDQLYPYQYPVTKAYEMMSCFEGLLEYYRVTKIEKYKASVIRFVDKVLESDFTIIGSCGCTHELFDHSTVRQANTNNEPLAQETCVTVTLMKLLYQLNLLTGESKYADAFERAFYNAYLGAFNTEHKIGTAAFEADENWILEALPFDSYSPLTAGIRGKGIGGLKRMPDGHYYGCCACIGSAGIGLFHKMSFSCFENGFVFQMYANGTIKAKTAEGFVDFEIVTKYPADGQVCIYVNPEKTQFFEIKLRIPKWAEKTAIRVGEIAYQAENGYVSISREWKKEDKVELVFDMPPKVLAPPSYAPQVLMNKTIGWANYTIPNYDEQDPIAKHHFALQRGPLILAQDNQLGYSVDDPVEVFVDENQCAAVREPEKKTAPCQNLIELAVRLKNGEEMHVIDYASAGKTWDEKSKMAAWMLGEI